MTFGSNLTNIINSLIDKILFFLYLYNPWEFFEKPKVCVHDGITLDIFTLYRIPGWKFLSFRNLKILYHCSVTIIMLTSFSIHSNKCFPIDDMSFTVFKFFFFFNFSTLLCLRHACLQYCRSFHTHIHIEHIRICITYICT
jgi:hypothetical protein